MVKMFARENGPTLLFKKLLHAKKNKTPKGEHPRGEKRIGEGRRAWKAHTLPAWEPKKEGEGLPDLEKQLRDQESHLPQVEKRN